MDWSIGDVFNTDGLKPDLVLVFYPRAFPVRWSLCSTTADFCTNYLATRDAFRLNRDAINYILNELVENAVKFSDGDTIRIVLGRDGDELAIVVDNHVGEPSVEPLQEILADLLSDEPIEVLMRRVEENAEHPEKEGSGLGFLTMMTDYSTRLGWRLHSNPESGNPPLLSTMARLDITRG